MGVLGNIAKNLRNITKQYTQTTSRPAIMQPYMATDTGAKLPIFPYPLIMIYELASNVDALRIPIETVNREMFKNGFEVVERFKYKCQNCGKEFEYKPTKEEGVDKDTKPKTPTSTKKSEGEDPTTDTQRRMRKKPGDSEHLECDECGSKDLLRPEPKNRHVLEKLYKYNVNNNNQTLKHVARQLERDLEVADAAYMLVLKNYWINPDGEIDEKKTQIKELLRIDPPQVAMIADADGRIGFDDKRIPVFVCPFFEHRDKRLMKPVCTRRDEHHTQPVRALRALCEVSSIYSIGIPQPKRVIYAEGEVIWRAGKYQPGLIYGFSPIYSIWSKVMALSHMDEYIRKYFDKMRPPRGLLVIASRNYESFRKAWNALEEKTIEDPYMIHPLTVEAEKGGRNLAQWLDFTGSLKELQFTEIRKELRQIIGATFGVLPLYFGELPTGWSQEGLQVTITNRAIKWGQSILQESFFDIIARMMGVDDWILRLKEGEEADHMRELEIEAQEINNHATLQTMGFAVERTHLGQWKVGKTPTFEQMPMEGAGRGDSLTGDKDRNSPVEGSPMHKRPSDPGGTAQGHPAPAGKSQGKFSPSEKAIIKRLNEFINFINKDIGHSFEFWHTKLVEDVGVPPNFAAGIISNWKRYKKKSGTLYFATVVDEDHPAQHDKPHLLGKDPQHTEEIDTERVGKVKKRKYKYTMKVEDRPPVVVTKEDVTDEESKV